MSFCPDILFPCLWLQIIHMGFITCRGHMYPQQRQSSRAELPNEKREEIDRVTRECSESGKNRDRVSDNERERQREWRFYPCSFLSDDTCFLHGSKGSDTSQFPPEWQCVRDLWPVCYITKFGSSKRGPGESESEYWFHTHGCVLGKVTRMGNRCKGLKYPN